MIFLLTNYYLGYQSKDEIDSACGMYRGQEIFIQGFDGEN